MSPNTPVTLDPTPGIPDDLRSWLEPIADLLIPGDATMPSASSVGIARRQLDRVLAARPDLLPDLTRAWVITAEEGAQTAIDSLQALDAAAYDAVRIVVAGGYYIHPEVRECLGYTGQEPSVVRVDVVPEYVEEGLLERVIARGQIFRDDG
jgi:hypothetical protein